jgi:N-carbamoyl-L-amino-acid hydrolase
MPDAAELLTAPRIDDALLQALMERQATFGDTGDGGVDRPALTDAHAAARDWLRAEMAGRGYGLKVDAIGNLFGVLDLAGPDAPLVMVGSHLDSQPRGGRFDGAYGVVAALAAIESVRAAAIDAGVAPRCNFAVADWMNEEGARFQPSLLGSGVFAGELDLDFALNVRDGDGLRVADELARTGYAGTDPAPDPSAYVEFHVECGPELEKAGLTIAPFMRYWGALKVRIVVTGEQAHTGPTAMPLRRDAVLGAAYLIAEIRQLVADAPGLLHSSVGRLEVSPNSPNIVPGRVVMFAELRSPDPDVLAWSEAALRDRMPGCADRAQVTAEIVNVDRRPAGAFDVRLAALAEQAADALGLGRMRLDTIGGHDAIPVLRRCPAIVVAVPSKDGVVHNPKEYTAPEDLRAGGDVLTAMLWRIMKAGGDLDRAAAGGGA